MYGGTFYFSHLTTLGYCSCVWNVGYEVDLDLLEAVQRQTKILQEYRVRREVEIFKFIFSQG